MFDYTMITLDTIRGFFDLSQPGILIKLIAAVGILLIGILFGRIVSKLIKRGLKEIELNRILREYLNVKVDVEHFINNFVTYLIYFIAVVMALEQIGLTMTVFYIILGVVLIGVLIFVLMTIKDFVPNAAANIFIRRKKIIKEGEHIKIKNIDGKVIKMDLIETKLETKEGDIVFVPNVVFLKNEVVKVKT